MTLAVPLVPVLLGLLRLRRTAACAARPWWRGRLLLLFAIPASPYVIFVLSYHASRDVMYQAPAVLAALTFALSRRSVQDRLPGRGGLAGRAA